MNAPMVTRLTSGYWPVTLALAAYAALSPYPLQAQQDRGGWTNIGPSPAAVEALAVDPHRSGTIFMGSIAGGVRKSVDGGMNWSVVNSGLTSPIVQALAIDASGSQTVYAGTVGGGLFKTVDAGATWQNIRAISGAVTWVAADPNRSGVIYAAVFNNLANGSIRKSIDGGVTWATVFPTTAAIFNITIDPRNSDVLYAPTVGHGAFKSMDGGQHWSAMPALTPGAIWTLALDPANSQVLYAGTNEDGIWKSTDAGNTWQHLGSPTPFPVYSLTVDPSATHTIYAGTNGGGVWTSSDGGVTWQPTGLSNGMVLSLAVDLAGVLYAGTNSAGAQVSRDLGATWSVLHAGIDGVNKFAYGAWIDPNNGRKILVGNEAMWGLVWSQDGGASWSVAGQDFTGRGSRGVAFDPSDSQRIYAGGMIGNAFFKSTDGGLTWSTRRFGSPAAYVIAVGVDSLSTNIVYAGTQNEKLFKSTDYGDTWNSTGSELSGAITYLTLDPTKSGRLFASTATAFYLSEDGGGSWTNVLNMPAWTVTIDPNRPSTVYATARTQGIFRSFDGGHTWQNINAGLTNLTMGRSAPVIIDPMNPRTLYVGSEGGGVFKSNDGGDHWRAVNSGLDDPSVSGLVMDPGDSSVLYACGPNGVYQTLTGGEATPFAAGGQSLSASVGSGSLSLTFPPGYVWTASSSASWLTLNGPASGTGNGTLSFQVAANAGPDRSATITVAGFSFTIEQQAGSIPGLSFIGSMPHIAAEHNWTTTFTLVNKSTASAQARLSLFGDPARALMLPLTFPQLLPAPAPLPLLAESLDRTLSANASLIIETAGSQTTPVQIGSAQLAATNNVDGFAILRQLVTQQETVVPLEVRNARSYLLAFDNTNGVVLGVALQNVSAQAANIPVVIRDDTGAQIGTPGAAIALAGNGHSSFMLSDPAQGFPVTANKRGTIEFDTPAGGHISVLAIRFTPPDNQFTSIPVLANVGTSGGSIAHLAAGGDGWQTTFVLINTGNNAAQATLSFFADNGKPLSLPLSGQSGSGTTAVASFVTQNLAAGATFIAQSTGSMDLLAGSAQLSTTGNVSGFAIFRHNDQEFAAPIESRNASGYIVAFDNTNGTATGVAINSISSQAVSVPVVIRDDTGAQIVPTDMIPLAANGHYAFTLATDRYPATAGIRGTIEFDTPPGGQIGVLAIRVPAAHTFTSLPTLAK